jgi:hypothetical protein
MQQLQRHRQMGRPPRAAPAHFGAVPVPRRTVIADGTPRAATLVDHDLDLKPVRFDSGMLVKTSRRSARGR